MKFKAMIAALALALSMLTACGAQTEPQQPAASAEAPAPQSSAAAGSESGPEAQPQAPAQSLEMPAYASQDPFVSFIKAPLTEKAHNLDIETGYTNYNTIIGLKDVALEKRINSSIREMYENAIKWEIPPYRGTGLIDPKIFENSGRSYDSGITFSGNDYLSIKGSKYMSSDDFIYNISDVYTATYDLRTGELLQLKDLFTPGYDYEAVINKRVMEYLHSQYADSQPGEYDKPVEDFGWFYGMDGGGVSLVAPFKGIRDDQKFCLTDYGLTVILDYNNHELEFSGFYIDPAYVEISYSDFKDGLLLQRGSDSKLYRYSSEPVKMLIGNQGGETVHEKQTLYEGDLNIYAEMELSYPEEFPEELVSQMRSSLTDMLVPLKPYIDSCNDDPDLFYYFMYESYGKTIGDYYSFSTHITIPSIDGGSADYTDSYTVAYDKSMNRLDTKDFFQEGFDYVSYLAQSFKTSIEDLEQYGSKVTEAVDYEALASDVSVVIDSDAIYFDSNKSVNIRNVNGDYEYDYDPSFMISFDSEEALVLKY